MTVDMGTVWDRTTEFLSDNLGAMLPVAALTILLPTAVTRVLTGALPELGMGTVYVAAFILSLPALWGQLFVIGLALEPDTGRAGAQRIASRAFVPAILTMLLLFVVWVVLALPLVIALASSGIDMAALERGSNSAFSTMSGGAAGFMLFYGLAVGVIFIVVLVRLLMLYPVIAAEGGVIVALRRALALSRGLFWRIFGVMLLFGLVYGVAIMAAGSVFGFLFRLIAPGAGPYGVGAIVVALILATVTTAYTLLISVFTAKLYRAVTAGAAKPA